VARIVALDSGHDGCVGLDNEEIYRELVAAVGDAGVPAALFESHRLLQLDLRKNEVLGECLQQPPIESQLWITKQCSLCLKRQGLIESCTAADLPT
jgi:hypothetical protein